MCLYMCESQLRQLANNSATVASEQTREEGKVIAGVVKQLLLWVHRNGSQ